MRRGEEISRGRKMREEGKYNIIYNNTQSFLGLK
jgi:hypothetical protein